MRRPPFPNEASMEALAIAAAPLAAFLSFSIQPLLGKQLLPLYGGSTPVWLGCSLFFQLALVLGYGLAVALLRLAPRVQAGVVVVLGLLALASFHVPEGSAASPSAAWIVGRLAPGALPALVLLFAVSPLLHGWAAGPDGRPPYHLYALSNAGSLLGLLAYPFLIEPFLGLYFQVEAWRGLLALLVVLLALAAVVVWRRAPVVASPQIRGDAGVSWLRVLLWTGLSATGVVQLLAATQHIAGEIGSHPLAWVGPLGLYLLGFTLAFSGRWRPWMTRASLVLLAAAFTGFMSEKGLSAAPVRGLALFWLTLLAGACSLLGAALLAHWRPAQRPEVFYLALGVGGSIGGIASALVFPRLFAAPVELPLAATALLIMGLLWMLGPRARGDLGLLCLIIVIPIFIACRRQLMEKPAKITEVVRLRDEVSNLRVELAAESTVLSSDSTTHGSQLTATPEARRRPTLYYTESTALGRALEKLQAARPSIRVGVVGLGTGTVAAYARKGDIFEFWDIDAKAPRVARQYFSFLADSAGDIRINLMDGRQAIEHSRDDFDLILIDAFTGDGIPSHLLTREAMSAAFARLEARSGVFVVHVSSRSASYFPVLQATARTLGFAAVEVSTDIREAADAADWDPTHTDYVVVCQPDRLFEMLKWFPEKEDEGRVTRVVRVESSPEIKPRQVWTDDRNATLDVLDMGRYLFGR